MRKIDWKAVGILLAVFGIVFYFGACFGNWYTIRTAYPIDRYTIDFDGQIHTYK